MRGKVRVHLIDNQEKYEIVGDFFEIISGLKSKKEIIDFFVGVLTTSEILMISRRIQIAKMLSEKNSYEEIKKKLKVGCQTIVAVDNWIHGRGDEYNNWICECIKKIEARKTKKIKSYRDYSLLDKYSNHRFWKEIFE